MENVICLRIKWEYTSISVNSTDKQLSELGADGWELVTAVNQDFIFKRPINEVMN